MASVSRSNRRTPVTLLVILAASMSGIECDELLPPRLEDPRTLVFTAKLESGTCTIESGVSNGAGAIDILCMNTYNEVLHDSESIRIEVDLWLVDHPEARAHVSFNSSALLDPTLISQGFLTLIPRRLAELNHQWPHRTTGNIPFYTFLKLTEKTNPQQGITYLQSDPAVLAMEGTVQVFKRVPAYRIPLTTCTIIYEIY